MRWSVNGINPRAPPVLLIFVRFFSALLAWGFTLSSVAPGSVPLHKQTIVKELRRTQQGRLPGTSIQRTCATGVTPLRNRYQKTRILTSAVIKSKDSCSAVLPVEADVFAALNVERMGLNETCGCCCTVTALREHLNCRAMRDWIVNACNVGHFWLFAWSLYPGRTSGRPTWSLQRRSPVWSSTESEYQQNWLSFWLVNTCLKMNIAYFGWAKLFFCSNAVLEILLGSILNWIKQLGEGCASAGHICLLIDHKWQ